MQRQEILPTRYVVGFLIDAGYTILIRKMRPRDQAGKLNGVGGKIEEDENPRRAMVREFREEAGRDTFASDWKLFCVMSGTDWEVHCFWSYGILSKCKSTTDEKLEIHSISDLPRLAQFDNCIENLPWLFAMIESQKRDGVNFYQVRYDR